MKIRIASDLHNEINAPHAWMDSDVVIPPHDEDRDSVLVVAGDLGVADCPDSYIRNLKDWADRFAHVIYVPGNHEFYGCEIHDGDMQIMEQLHDLKPNLYYSTLAGRTVEIEGYHFVCHPLFCDMGYPDKSAECFIEQTLNDFRSIRIGSVKIRGEDYRGFLYDALEFIDTQINRIDDPSKTIIVTHWAPSYRSVHPRFQGSAINGGFTSNLDARIIEWAPSLWIHGHTHDPFDYNIDETRVICNPHGYGRERGYNYHLEIDI